MHLSSELGQETASIHKADTVQLYGSMISELQQVRHEKKGRLFFLTLWDSVAPSGNIYRYLAMQTERLKHCDDLWSQVNALAAEAEAKGTMGKEKFVTEFLAEVRSAPSSCADIEGAAASAEMTGFMPLEEFLATPTWRCMGMVFPADKQEFRGNLYAFAIGLLVMWMQITAPLFIFINQAMILPDRLKSFSAIEHMLNWEEMLCLGANLPQKLHTIMGIGLLLLLLLILTNYAFTELASLQKSQYLPMDRSWIFVGNVTNIWVTLWTGFAAPVLFWNEGTPTSMSMDALTLLWLFTLDDLSSYGYNLIMNSDEDFKRSASWTKALLGQCPVRITDLRDDEGRWHFRLGPQGLVRPDGELCQTRYSQKRVDFGIRKTASSKFIRPDEEEFSVQIHRSPTHVETLPHGEKFVMVALWNIVGHLFYVFNIAAPFVWFVVNKPCVARDMH